MVEQTSEIELSPLDQIRQTEGEVTRRIAAAREKSEEILENARKQAAVLKHAAHEAGKREGQAGYKEIISRAEEEANALVADAHYQAEKLRRRGQQRMKNGVIYAVNIVIGLAEEMNKK